MIKSTLSLTLLVLVGACSSDSPTTPAIDILPTAQVAGAIAPYSSTPTITVVMSNLNSPRGLAWGPDGGLYVAEAGLNSAGGPCVAVARGANCYSGTGSITRLKHGSQERLVTGLPSAFNAATNDIIGPHDIAFLRHGQARAYVSIGWGGDPAARAGLGELGGSFGSLLRLTRPRRLHEGRQHYARDGENDDEEGEPITAWTSDAPGVRWRVVADVSAFEGQENPAGGRFDSNPYGLLMEQGSAFVADAGGNSLLKVQGNGHVSLVATFAPTPVPPGPFNPPFTQSEAVPTEVARGPDGALYVSGLSGVPFLPGAASIYRVGHGQAPEVYASGFTQITDFAWGRDGSLYVVQYASAPFLNGPGAVIRVAPDGARTTITTALFHPTAIAIGPHGALYVSNNGNLAGVGEVVRIDP